MPTHFNNPFLQFLETDDLGLRANLFSRLPQNLPSQQMAFGQAQFQPQFNQFLGALGGQIRGGQDPTLTFSQFLDQNFDFGRQLRRAPVHQTGMGMGRFVSPARHLFQF